MLRPENGGVIKVRKLERKRVLISLATSVTGMLKVLERKETEVNYRNRIKMRLGKMGAWAVPKSVNFISDLAWNL